MSTVPTTPDDDVPRPPTVDNAPSSGAARRHEDIVRLAAHRSVVRVEELVELLGVSRMTVHRDLETLNAQGRVQRVRGGIRKITPRLVEADVRVRRELRTAVKRALAAKAAELVQDGDVIVLDDSSTVAAMVEHLVLRRDLTVLTHSLAAMRTVADLV
ncbi:MAG: DeoR/GlpR family DNA-binding transcription regulator, partial [Bifidobacteriaceae bacterium]|nr:DeoR/GlpR family DNA-binding transcription regulator [Bifidobacteriaceae bacterium]